MYVSENRILSVFMEGKLLFVLYDITISGYNKDRAFKQAMNQHEKSEGWVI